MGDRRGHLSAGPGRQMACFPHQRLSTGQQACEGSDVGPQLQALWTASLATSCQWMAGPAKIPGREARVTPQPPSQLLLNLLQQKHQFPQSAKLCSVIQKTQQLANPPGCQRCPAEMTSFPENRKFPEGSLWQHQRFASLCFRGKALACAWSSCTTPEALMLQRNQ